MNARKLTIRRVKSADDSGENYRGDWHPREDLRTLERRLGYRFIQRELLKRALTPSVSKNQADGYQLLEYVGDGALRYVIPKLLRHRYPGAQQGELSRMYSVITCNTNLAFMSYRLRLPYYFRFTHRPNVNRKMLADVVEAVIGAVDECGGIAAVTSVCERIFKVDLELSRFHEPQDTLLRILRHASSVEALRENSSANSPLRQIRGHPRVSYQAHVIHKKWGKLGHVSILRLNGNIIVANGEGYDAESANNNAASVALLKLFPKLFPSDCDNITWRLPP
jgi:dsRNA-specific ribonuclease